MAALFFLALIICLTNSHAEKYLNVDVAVSCGFNENCSIICNETESCSRNVFNLFNNHIIIECSAEYACLETYIYATNVTSLVIIGDDNYSMMSMRVYVDSSSQQTIVNCTAFYACGDAQFHYESMLPTVHHCTGVGSCKLAQIHALSDMKLYCSEESACSDCVVMMSSNISKTIANNVIINVLEGATGTGLYDYYPMHIVSFYPINMSNIICVGGCSLNTIFLYYGLPLHFCIASNQECVKDMSKYKNINDINVIDTYYDDMTDIDIDYNSSMQSNEDIVILLWDETRYTIVAPYLNKLSSISIVCFHCYGIIFNLRNAQNAMLTVFGIIFYNCIIYGSTQYFEFNGYGGWAWGENMFWTNWTQNIRFNSIRTLDEQSVIEVGQSFNVSIECGYDLSCTDLWVSSSLELTNIGLLYSNWNIRCNSKGYQSCVKMYTYFSEFDYLCVIVPKFPLKCIRVLLENNDDENMFNNNYNMDIIFTFNELTNNQRELLINDYNEYKMNVTTKYSVNRSKLLLKLGYLSSYRSEYYVKFNETNLTFTDFAIYFDDMYTVTNTLKIESHIKCINKATKKFISALSSFNFKYSLINSTELLFRKDYNNNNLEINVIIPELSVQLNEWLFPLLFSLIGILILVIIIKLIQYFYRKYHEEYISNPLILTFGIGEYDNNPSNPDFQGQVDNIPVDIDIKHLIKLFQNLNYQIIDNSIIDDDDDDDEDDYDDDIKIYWTKDEFIQCLMYTGNILSQSIDIYDALIVIISCHGIENRIITSDYKLIDKDEIHERLSINYTNIRSIPRIFIFDCCSGDETRTNNTTTIASTGKYAYSKIDSNTYDEDAFGNINHAAATAATAATASVNLDHRLVTINAANIGFQSRMDYEDGSYLINQFKKDLEKSLNKKQCWQQNKNLGEIFSDIQQYLHKKGQQQTTNTFNNNTSYLIFKKNTNKLENIKFETKNVKDLRKTSFSERADYTKNIAHKIFKLTKKNKNKTDIQDTIMTEDDEKNFIDDKIELVNKFIAYFNEDSDTTTDGKINANEIDVDNKNPNI